MYACIYIRTLHSVSTVLRLYFIRGNIFLIALYNNIFSVRVGVYFIGENVLWVPCLFYGRLSAVIVGALSACVRACARRALITISV